jgi:hypothetical protein
VAEVGRFRRRGRPFDLARGIPSPGRYSPDELTISETIEAIRPSPVEIGYGFDAGGRQIFRQVGDDDEIRGFDPKDLAAIADGTFVHNHPPYTKFAEADPRRRAGSFSARDLVFMYEAQLSAIVAVTAERTYRVGRGSGGSFLDPGEIRTEYARLLATVEAELSDRSSRGIISVEEAEAEGRLADEVMDRLQRFFDYSQQEVGNDVY